MSKIKTDVSNGKDIVRRNTFLRQVMLSFMLLASATAQQAETVAESGWELRICAVEDNLPYSNRKLQGFEDRIAALLADELGANLHYVWLTRTHNPELEASLLREGLCDMFMGVADGQEPFLTTISYYQSTAVFVIRTDAPFAVASFDDPVLSGLEIGVVRSSPADYALAGRGMIENVRHFSPRDDVGAIVDAVIDGNVDVGIVWGPIAGYVELQRNADLTLTPVTPQIDLPFLPFVLPVSIGVRPDEVALRDLLNDGIAKRWRDIQIVLEEFNIPLLPLPKPTVNLGGS